MRRGLGAEIMVALSKIQVTCNLGYLKYAKLILVQMKQVTVECRLKINIAKIFGYRVLS